MKTFGAVTGFLAYSAVPMFVWWLTTDSVRAGRPLWEYRVSSWLAHAGHAGFYGTFAVGLVPAALLALAVWRPARQLAHGLLAGAGGAFALYVIGVCWLSWLLNT